MLLNYFEIAVMNVIETPKSQNGYVQISQSAEQQFIAVINGIEQSSKSLAIDLISLDANVSAIHSYAVAANQYIGNFNKTKYYFQIQNFIFVRLSI